MQRLEISHPPVLGARFHHAVKSRSPERCSRRYQSKRPVRVPTRPQIHVAAPKTRKSHLHARIRFSRHLRLGIQPCINHFSGRAESAKPTGIRKPPGSHFAQLHDFAGHPFCYFQRRYRKIQLVHPPADEFHQEPEHKLPREIHLAPHFQLVERRVLVKVPDSRVHPLWVERRPPQALKAGDQSGVRRLANLQFLFFRDSLVDPGTDHSWFSEHAIEPRSLALTNSSARQPHQPFDGHL